MRHQMIDLLLESQRDGSVIVTLVCAVLIAVAISGFVFCLLNESIPIFFRHLILWPLGGIILFIYYIPIYMGQQATNAEKIADIVERSSPSQVLVTRVTTSRDLAGGDEYWVDYRFTNLEGSPDKRVKLELFNIDGQRAFVQTLFQECASRDADTSSLFPARIFSDPVTQTPVAIVIDNLLLPLDQESFASTRPSKKFSLW